MEHDEFLKATKERFGDKVSCLPLKVKDDTLSLLPWTEEEIKAYPVKAWLVEEKCPACEAELLGLFGSFDWGIIHGIGFCSNCKQIEFQYYHYIAKGKQPLKAFAVYSF